MHGHVRIFALTVALWVTSCGDRPSVPPKAGDLIGTYVLTKASQAFLLKHKAYKAIPTSCITLWTNFQLTLANLPDCVTNGFGNPSGGFLSAHGRWQIHRELSGRGWRIDFHIDESGQSLQRGMYGMTDIYHPAPPYSLRIVIGDPDSDESIDYEKGGS